jgi:hypothetical protein
MGQLAPDEVTSTADNKKPDVRVDTAWNRFQRTLWIYYYAQWIWIGLFGYSIYFCSQSDYTVQMLWVELSLKTLTQSNINSVSADYLLLLLFAMPLLLLFFTRVIKGLIKKPTFSLRTYNIISIIRILMFVIAGQLAGYLFGLTFLCSMIYLNMILRKT